MKQDTRFYVHLPSDRMQIVHPMIRPRGFRAGAVDVDSERGRYKTCRCVAKPWNMRFLPKELGGWRRFREHLEDPTAITMSRCEKSLAALKAGHARRL